jgi:hypothetical protein
LFLRQGRDKRTREYRVGRGDDIVWQGPASSFSKDEKEIIKILMLLRRMVRESQAYVYFCIIFLFVLKCLVVVQNRALPDVPNPPEALPLLANPLEASPQEARHHEEDEPPQKLTSILLRHFLSWPIFTKPLQRKLVIMKMTSHPKSLLECLTSKMWNQRVPLQSIMINFKKVYI